MNTFAVHLRPICIACSCEMACVSNGVYVKLLNSHAYIAGDLFKCQNCGNSIVGGFAKKAHTWDGSSGLIVAEIEL